MNWLPGLCTRLRNTGLPLAQVEALVLRTIALSGICDQVAPLAPAPELELLPAELLPDIIRLFWVRGTQRELSLRAGHDGTVTLELIDRSVTPAAGLTERMPSHDLLKSSVAAFFDGWTPPS